MIWKIGVNSQARKLIGSAPGWAGVSGGWGVGDATEPDPPGPPGAHAATTTTMRIRSPIDANGIRRRRERVTSWTPR